MSAPPAPILVVEDDAVFRESLCRALRARGVNCLACDSLDAARAELAGAAPAGAVVDLRLPGGSGLDLVREIHTRHPQVAVVVLTAFGSIATALEAVRLGARDYLVKPADPDHILAALRGEAARPPARAPDAEDIPSLDRVEWEYIQQVLSSCGHNISKAARLLGLDRRSLQRKLAKYPPHR